MITVREENASLQDGGEAVGLYLGTSFHEDCEQVFIHREEIPRLIAWLKPRFPEAFK